LRAQIGERFAWAVAPAHPDDIALATQAHDLIRQTKPDALLIVAPRFPDRKIDAPWPRRSKDDVPSSDEPIWLCDTFGELGLVYQLTRAALIGGTFSDIEGHSPWEAVALNTAIMHGPRHANFAPDYKALIDADGSFPVNTATDITNAVLSEAKDQKMQNAALCRTKASAATDALAQRLIALLEA
jgi:3-deoxy-D-manno-octulosonic-acid transferase